MARDSEALYRAIAKPDNVEVIVARNVRFWHLADIDVDDAHVRSWRVSGHR